MSDFSKLTIPEIARGLRSHDFTVAELVEFYLNKINARNHEINAFLEIYNDLESQIAKAQKRIDAGEEGMMIGIPVAIKDNILVEGKLASASSKVLENYKATYTATAAQKLIDAGAILIGRTNMDEFAMGGSTENSAYMITKNPVNPEYVPGGSSGGSTAAVAMGGVPVALGSDTGGSIRQPASFCGVVGLKPTYGSVSRHGLMAMASSLDVIGPLARNVSDAEIVFNVIKGQDPKDATSISYDEKNSDSSKKTENLDGEEKVENSSDDEKPIVKTIGVPTSFLKEGVDEPVINRFNESIARLKSEGYEIKEIDLPNLKYSLAVYYILMPAEVSSNMARFDGIKYGPKIEGENLIEGYFKTRGQLIGKEVKRRIMLGTYVLSAGYADQYYKKAWQVRNLISRDFQKAFESVDVIAMPTSPTPAFKIGEKSTDPLEMYLADIFTISANLAGIPAISIPDGTVSKNGVDLPVGMQFLATHKREDKLFELGKKFEIIKA